tara:strand:+ start:80 stop:298 length:219 start_codon:yes stop_codon:yes gene_type:complete
MKDIEKRLHNTEKALLSLAAVLSDTASADNEDYINSVMTEYLDANTSLGSNADSSNFIKHVDVSYVKQPKRG